MAQGPHLSQEIKILIARIHLEHPDYGPTNLREELLRRMKETGLDRNFGPDWPGVSAVGKVLANIRSNLDKRPPETKRIDMPWSIGSLPQYSIPPEALPMVLRLYAQPMSVTVRVATQRLRVKAEPISFSIRDALWVSRLSKLFSDPQDIWDFAAWCSVQERTYEAIGEATDFANIDRLLLKKLGLNRLETNKGGKDERSHRKEG